MKHVTLKLTRLEADQLYVGANEHAESLRGDPDRYGSTGARDVAAFWRALEKLQAARRAEGRKA